MNEKQIEIIVNIFKEIAFHIEVGTINVEEHIEPMLFDLCQTLSPRKSPVDNSMDK